MKNICRIAVFTILLAAVSQILLVSCNKESQKGKNDIVTVGLISFNRIPEKVSDVNDLINAHIAKKYPDLNVSIDLQLYGPADYNQKISLSIASGQPIDIFDPVPLTSFVAQKQLLPLENLIDEFGQGIKKKLDEDFGPGVLRATVFNNHLYSIPVNKGMALHLTLVYDKDILALSGYSIDDINSLEDLTKVFKALKEKNPDIIPFAPINAGDTQLLRYLTYEHEIDSLSDAVLFPGVVFGNSGKVVNLYETREFYNGAKLMNDWYKKGYLPKDVGSAQVMAQQYFGAGRLFCTIGGYSGNQADIALSASTGRNIGIKHLRRAYFDTQAVNFVTTAIAANTKVPEAAMKMLNLLYTDEFIINTILYGIEGRDFIKVGEHHWRYPDGKDANTVPYTAALCTGVFGSESLQLQPEGTSWDDVLVKLRDNRESKRSPYFGFNFDPSDLRNELSAITNVYNQYIPGLICGTLDPDTAIPELLSRLKAAGIDKVIAEKQKQLDLWISQNR